MNKEEAIHFANCLKKNYTIDFNDMEEFCDMAIKALEQQKPMENFESVKDHILKLASDYKCWDNRLTHDEALELCHTLEQEPCEDVMVIHTQGLDEGIRCAMCTNSMKSDRGCDGGCVVNESMYKEVMNTIRNHIVPLVTPKPRWIPCDEKLPEDGELVLFSTKTDRVYEGRFFVDETDFQWYAFRDKAFTYNNVVTAWLPLPKPYKKDKESKE